MKKQKVLVSLTKETIEKVHKEAEDKHTSRSWIIESILIKFFGKSK